LNGHEFNLPLKTTTTTNSSEMKGSRKKKIKLKTIQPTHKKVCFIMPRFLNSKERKNYFFLKSI
jgi:hypothetical protein